MKCPQCGTENRPDARFCLQCGAPLVASVPPPAGAPAVRRATTSPRPEPVSLPPTRPLANVTDAFALLPEGALIGNERYVVLEGRALNERWNLYRAEDTRPSRCCPQCGSVTDLPQERYCASCGADISSVVPSYLRYRIWESAEGGAFSACEYLLQRGITHVGLRMPK